MPVPTLTPERFNRVIRALSNPTRYEMFRRIYSSPDTINCGAACDDLTISAATGSHHLRELELADLISVTRDGRFKQLAPRRDIWELFLAQLGEL